MNDSAADSAACLRCGVCCFSRLETYVRVSGEDWARLGDDAARLAHFIGNRAYLRMREGRCAALETRVAADGAAEHFCTIYQRRPQVCRDLARGSPECEAERALKGARPGPPHYWGDVAGTDSKRSSSSSPLSPPLSA